MRTQNPRTIQFSVAAYLHGADDQAAHEAAQLLQGYLKFKNPYTFGSFYREYFALAEMLRAMKFSLEEPLEYREDWHRQIPATVDAVLLSIWPIAGLGPDQASPIRGLPWISDFTSDVAECILVLWSSGHGGVWLAPKHRALMDAQRAERSLT